MAADKDLTACCLISGDGAVSGREYDSKWTRLRNINAKNSITCLLQSGKQIAGDKAADASDPLL